HLCLLHRRNGLHGVFLRPFPLDPFVDFVHGDGRSNDACWLSQASCELLRVRSIGEELNPTRRIENDHTRSFFSRKPVVRIPRTKPRIAPIGLSGTRADTPPYAITWHSRPG